MDEWYCTDCADFLPVDQFKPGPKRWVCRKHYNQRWHRTKMELWTQEPQRKKAHLIWQIAYRDGVAVFRQKINISQAQVQDLMRDHGPDQRLLPLDPTKPLSVDNYHVASLGTRKLMCRVWKGLGCAREYAKVLNQAQ